MVMPKLPRLHPAPHRIRCSGTRQLTLLGDSHEWLSKDGGGTWEGTSALHEVWFLPVSRKSSRKEGLWRPGFLSWGADGALRCPHCGGTLLGVSEDGAEAVITERWGARFHGW